MISNEKECNSYLVKTLFSCSYKQGERITNLLDTCHIYSDDLNKGDWVALSLSCSKVGQGFSYKEAYVDLISSIIQAIHYYIKSKPDEKVDIGPKQPTSKFIEAKNGYFMKESIQFELLCEVIEEIERCFLGKKDHRIIPDKYGIDGYFELTPIFNSVRGFLFKERVNHEF